LRSKDGRFDGAEDRSEAGLGGDDTSFLGCDSADGRVNGTDGRGVIVEVRGVPQRVKELTTKGDNSQLARHDLRG
jgi:hypothetical protein